MSQRKRKVFGIGLGRTGTLSLANALTTLGYHTGHFAEGLALLQFNDGLLGFDHNAVAQWDALTDVPVAVIYKELDRAFDGSKFILTVRDRDDWLSSLELHFSKVDARTGPNDPTDRLALRKLAFGSTRFDSAVCSAAYERHVNAVTEYFHERPEDLLVLDICGGVDWHPLCEFLGEPIPNESFPHKHNSSKRKRVNK